MIEKIAQYFLSEEYELGRQLCISADVSLEEMAEYLLEIHVPKKWNRQVPISNFKFYNYQGGRKFLSDRSVISCDMGQFYTSLEICNYKPVKFRFACLWPIDARKHSIIHKIIIMNFKFTINKISRSFYKTFIFLYKETRSNVKRRILNHITTQ